MPRHFHPEDGMVYACPACDVAGEVYLRTHKTKDFDRRFRCHKCGAEFDEAKERESRENKPGDDAVAYVDDGIPSGLDPSAKETVRKLRND